ncbi:MAG: diheme cytochrome c [Burkholderiaceae bacterium]|nr:diheme cytochrome c [Burkholderiaceae bacterium]
MKFERNTGWRKAPLRHAATLAALTSLLAAGGAHAAEGRLMPGNVPPAYTQECASCHTAYPPGLLPAASWQRIMSGLGKHYGTDASLDAATVQQLSGWLQANAGTYKRVAEPPAQDRITNSSWFVRKHRKIDPAVWKHVSVKSAANCAACHTGADQGVYDEHRLQFPAGLDARYRRPWND